MPQLDQVSGSLMNLFYRGQRQVALKIDHTQSISDAEMTGNTLLTLTLCAQGSYICMSFI